jgi:hypothetical protein
VEEWLLFGGVTLKGAYVSPWDSQTPILIEPNLADAPAALLDQAPVAACIASDCAILQELEEFSLDR